MIGLDFWLENNGDKDKQLSLQNTEKNNVKDKEGKVCAIDIGLVNYLTAVISDGTVIYVKAKQYMHIYNKYKRKLAQINRTISDILKHSVIIRPPRKFNLRRLKNETRITHILISFYSTKFREKMSKRIVRRMMLKIVKVIRYFRSQNKQYLRIRKYIYAPEIKGGVKIFPKKTIYSKSTLKPTIVLTKLEREREKLYKKRDLTLRQIRRTVVNGLFRLLKEMGVKEVVVGYPYKINKNIPNETNVNLFQYRKLLFDMALVGYRMGINVILREEYGTSKTCSICGEQHEKGRIMRGLYKCEKTGKVINADLNGAINIFKEQYGYTVEVKKRMTFIATINKFYPKKSIKKKQQTSPL
uniref:Cas12f1-like TNB domain-containing protein n=1 Tax=Saccharolobus islandicus TaxID=43080 RepID=Q5W2Y9_SACIS|nr:zinc ribbon domain-containing protein [Sulfolobus islandicus]CAG38157.1 hypothetical protein [Sulfolobus islandicus]